MQTVANSNLSASSVTDFTSLSAALTATDEIDSVGGTIGAVDFTAVEAASSTEGVQYTDTATTAEVLSEASGNTVDVDLATVAFDTNGELDAASGTGVYVDADKALTTTQSVETTYRVNQETGDVTVKESNGEGKYAVEAGATAYVSSDGQLTTSETSPGERTEDPLAALDSALAQVDSLRSDLGAIQNRFESAITNLSSARSRIEDADYATEVANMTKNQILQQAGTSVLAQANQLPQSVLSLLG